jgi:hypothetical protein
MMIFQYFSTGKKNFPGFITKKFAEFSPQSICQTHQKTHEIQTT